jgi:monooxygenase
MMMTTATPPQHFDVLIVGAGLSGIGAAYHLQTECPTKSFTILEARSTLGGTWDLFRYPGVRSDSDMYTLGYAFRPWPNPKAIADGPSILTYIRETAEQFGIDRKIRYGHKVKQASWSSDEARWTLEVEQTETNSLVRFTCNFLYACSGYYDYTGGYLPTWNGIEQFGGQVVHPQAWSENLDYKGKRVVVIGSGATAVTLVPAMASEAAHVTMLQRSPTYIVAAPSEDKVANWLREHLPARLAHGLARWRLILLGIFFYTMARKRPDATKQQILKLIRDALGAEYQEVDKHFSPSYNPWDQRVCIVPDGDLFNSIKAGKVSIVTDRIETFTANGIKLASGDELPADIIITATGLVLKLLGGIQVDVDGRPIDFTKTLSYKGTMYSGVPNLASAFGYTNASWTLKCELISGYVCRLLNFMDKNGYNQCTPQRVADVTPEPILTLTSGYVQRGLPKLPQQGTKAPWKLYQNYLQDFVSLKLKPINDGIMEFKKVRLPAKVSKL